MHNSAPQTMAKRTSKRKAREEEEDNEDSYYRRLHPETKKYIWAIAFFVFGVLLVLAGLAKAGPFGDLIHRAFVALVGVGYYVLPVISIMVAGVLFTSHSRKVLSTTSLGAGLLILSILGTIDVATPGDGGYLGQVLGALRIPFGNTAAIILNVAIAVIALLVTVNTPIRMPWQKDPNAEEDDVPELVVGKLKPEEEQAIATASKSNEDDEDEKDEDEEEKKTVAKIKAAEADANAFAAPILKKLPPQAFKNYVPPPLDLLKSSNEKPTTGDLRANANIIKRTLESFGIAVEMGEINIGPKVTRYTLKPAEGVKVTRILALSSDLALALAAHPIRIEAPIPGKSLVGIEVPNKTAALVRLGSLMAYPEFHTSGALGFVLGRDVTGEPIFANIEKMPHLLIAGATGSGKSVTLHSLIISLLYKNSPQTLKLILIDPKRVELSIYENLPHLVSPVITESKKSVGVFKWAVSEMDRRYMLLQSAGARDIKSYNEGGGKDDPLPFMLIVVDELADLMTMHGRDVEGSIVRLAQMARATGIHLLLATQRPSVEVITGLIKANITSRIALQVASQIDSRTILDGSGAEKLLGGGDLLFINSNLSKPKRIQGCYVSEEEIHAVADFIRENNPMDFGSTIAESGRDAAGTGSGSAANIGTTGANSTGASPSIFDDFGGEGDDDDLYDEAIEVVREAQKASASLLQRRLKVGYARAARLLDIMEEKGVIGPGDGAKPRDVYLDTPSEPTG
jgi:DNA segregation ATPase FtsK/SpoIIIE, S-DNA-T family